LNNLIIIIFLIYKNAKIILIINNFFIGTGIIENTYNYYEKHDYHVMNIKDVEWDTLPWGANYHNILFNPKTKEATFALFIRIARLCWLGPKQN